MLKSCSAVGAEFCISAGIGSTKTDNHSWAMLQDKSKQRLVWFKELLASNRFSNIGGSLEIIKDDDKRGKNSLNSFRYLGFSCLKIGSIGLVITKVLN